MATRTKLEIVRIIQRCALLYKTNLSGKNVLFVATHENNAAFFETLFTPQNFMHLTGVKSRLSSDQFFSAAANNRLSVRDILLPNDGAVELKMDVLPQLMNIHTNARMVGDYDNLKPLLITNKLTGTVTMAMGFVNVKDFYIPNTALKKDIREITTGAARRKVLAIFVKNKRDAKYQTLTYIAKDMTVDDSILQNIMHDKVDLHNLSASFTIPKRKKVLNKHSINNNAMGKVILICGKIGAGKTTYANQLAEKQQAVIFSHDDIMLGLFGARLYEEDKPQFHKYAPWAEQYMKQKAGECARAGAVAICANGFWSREERDDLRKLYTNMGVRCELHFVNPTETQRKANIKKRNTEIQQGMPGYVINEEDFHHFFEAPDADEADVIINQTLPSKETTWKT